jgi:Putative auto-transporter adhesin, head GIN domain
MRSIVPFFVFALAASAPALAVEPVAVPPFRAIELHGGGIVNIVPAPMQRVTLVEGSTQFTAVRVDREGKLVIDACDRQCPRDYHLRVQIESPHVLGLGVDGGGLMTAAPGFAPQSEIGVAVNGGGKIDVRSIDVANVGAAVNGGGEILVRARGALGASVHGGGDIVYWGNPTVATSINGGGAVHRGG